MELDKALQDALRANREREEHIRKLESEVRSLSAAISGNDPHSDLSLFDIVPPHQLANVITLAQIQDAWAEGLLLNISEAAKATGKSVATLSATYQRAGANLPTLRMMENRPTRNNRTTLIYIGWLAEKWPHGAGTSAWLKGRESYREWKEANLDRP